MKFSWFLMILGALLVFQGVALVYTGYHVSNALIIIPGACFGVPGMLCMNIGRNRRKDILEKRRVNEG